MPLGTYRLVRDNGTIINVSVKLDDSKNCCSIKNIIIVNTSHPFIMNINKLQHIVTFNLGLSLLIFLNNLRNTRSYSKFAILVFNHIIF